MGNVEMSMLLTNALIDAFTKTAPGTDDYSDVYRQAFESINYLSKSWRSQQNWLVNYKARKDTAMNFVSQFSSSNIAS
jgi:hypothetical protein